MLLPGTDLNQAPDSAVGSLSQWRLILIPKEW